MTEARARKVLLLDLYARRDGFLGDGALGAVGALLRREGLEVSWLQSVRDADPAGQDAWLARVAREVSVRTDDFVVLPRAWDRGVTDAIRAVLGPGAQLIRLAGGVAAAMDDAFDHVLDPAGIVTLARGATPEDKPLWQPVRASDLRARPRADDTGLVVSARSLDGLSHERPMMSGPASGCPFLLDVRKNPVFERAGLDASVIQTRGCSFCLDNNGAYATPPEAEVVGAWLARWRSLRAADPAVREVLLTDERPHPYLPAFFDALEREPALGGLELMIKSRVDWLLEFADGPLTRALESAERSGSVLHVYLVGFENFDPFHLELFNKGVTVEDNVRALEKLRALAERFPRSFEYLKYRAHGIVLFTPWTTPEALLENARWMHALRFHELRAEALHTRLRLYPRTPLHALARADGLLADDFGARGDRAVEQGYDASVPWKFRDPRVEAIQRICVELTRVDRARGEAFVLELATHLVLRYPALAAVPSVAWLPARYTLRMQRVPVPGGEADGVGPIIAGFDMELEAIALGLKRAALKEGVESDHAEGLVAAYRAMGFHADVVGLHGLHLASGTHSEGRSHATVAVAGMAEDLAAVLELQRAHAEGEPAPIDAMGALMGYPACCVAAFQQQRDRGDNLDNDRSTFLRAPHEALDPLVNRVAHARLISHHLCTPACEPSRAFARALFERIESLEPRSAAWLGSNLAQTVLRLDYDCRFELRGEWEGDSFRVDAARYLDRRHAPGFAADLIARLALDRTGARFTLRDGQVRHVSAARPLLVTPGQPLAGAALAAIAPDPEPISRPLATNAPRLPAAIRVGARARGHRVESIETAADHHEVVLASGDERLRLELRRPSDRAATLRVDAWAIDVDRPEALTEDARAVITVFARALAAASRLERG